MKAKNGISLIVLVITIVVIIILAAAVILSLGDNNPINSSKVAQLSQTKGNIQSAVDIYVNSAFANTAGAYDKTTLLTTAYATGKSAILSATPVKDKSTVSGVTTGDIYEIIDAGFTALNVSKPSDGTWYYSMSTGNVYVSYATEPSYSNDTTKAFIIVAAE